MHRPLLIAHRGDTVSYPENTLIAFLSAFEKGADGIECDVQLFEEDIIVVHDYLFDTQKTYPKLTDVLLQCASRGRVEIEIKSFTPDILPHLKTVIHSIDPANIELTTSITPLIPTISELFSDTPIGAIFDACFYEPWMTEDILTKKIIGEMHLLHATTAHIGHIPVEKLTVRCIQNCHNEGIKIHYHIGRGAMEEQMTLFTRLSELQIDQCTFDDMALITALKSNRSLS